VHQVVLGEWPTLPDEETPDAGATDAVDTDSPASPAPS
jgi:hypothetical protein